MHLLLVCVYAKLALIIANTDDRNLHVCQTMTDS